MEDETGPSNRCTWPGEDKKPHWEATGLAPWEWSGSADQYRANGAAKQGIKWQYTHRRVSPFSWSGEKLAPFSSGRRFFGVFPSEGGLPRSPWKGPLWTLQNNGDNTLVITMALPAWMANWWLIDCDLILSPRYQLTDWFVRKSLSKLSCVL